MKRLLTISFVLVLFLTLCSCTSKNADKVNTDTEILSQTVTTDCFSLELPEKWVKNAGYETFVSERVDCGVLFYEKASYNAKAGGTLFGIYVEPVGEIPLPKLRAFRFFNL